MGVASILDRSISGSFTSNVFNIRSFTFINCAGLTSVSFPQCYSIGKYAFSTCTSLTSVSFPNATSIGEYAFSGCTSLTTIYVGTNLSTVCILGINAFNGCAKLTSIYVPSSLVNSYKSATNWSDYASIIKAY